MRKTVEVEENMTFDNINVRFERDASLRAVEVLVLTCDRDGVERQAVKLIVSGKGDIVYIGKPQDLIDGVDVV